MKAIAEKYSTHGIVTALVLAFVWLQARVQSILPAVMQDEYIYSMQARKIPLAELEYPNYLYSLVFSSTNACGINYYSCAKNLNLFFFAGFVAIIFFLSLYFLGKWWAFGLSLATLLSPLGAYTSLFMPESMNFFFALLSIVLLWWAAKQGLWWQYLIAGSVVGLTALVKPHALFLAGGAVLFLLVIHRKQWVRFGISFASFIVGTLATKFALGVLLAGPNGLTLFGSNYTSSFTTFTEDLRGSGAKEALVASGETLAMASGGGNVLADFVGQTVFQIGWQSAAVFLLTGGLIAVLLGSLRGSAADEVSGERRFAQLILISLGSMVLVIAAFAAMVTIMGDDHSNRLLLRYYEFLIAPLAIAAIAVAKHSARGNVISWVAGGLTAVIGASVFLIQEPTFIMNFADSPIMMGVTSSEFAGGLAVALALGLGAAAFLVSKIRLTVLGSLVIFSLVFFGFSSVNRLHAQASTISPVDSAGIFARDYLAGVDPEAIHFVGANRQLTLASIFWMDKPDVSFSLIAPLSKLPQSSVPAGTEWVMTLDGTSVDVTPRFVINGNGWSLLNVSASEKHFFNQAMQDTPIESTSGLGPISTYGQFVLGERATVSFAELIPAGAKARLEILVGQSGSGQRIEFKLGDGVALLDLPDAGNRATAILEFNNTLPASVIEITAPEGAVEMFSMISIELDQ